MACLNHHCSVVKKEERYSSFIALSQDGDKLNTETIMVRTHYSNKPPELIVSLLFSFYPSCKVFKSYVLLSSQNYQDIVTHILLSRRTESGGGGANSEAVIALVGHMFPAAVLEESFAERLVFSVPQSAVSSLARCFQQIEDGKYYSPMLGAN